jgi:stress response protein YsnF
MLGSSTRMAGIPNTICQLHVDVEHARVCLASTVATGENVAKSIKNRAGVSRIPLDNRTVSVLREAALPDRTRSIKASAFLQELA